MTSMPWVRIVVAVAVTLACQSCAVRERPLHAATQAAARPTSAPARTPLPVLDTPGQFEAYLMTRARAIADLRREAARLQGPAAAASVVGSLLGGFLPPRANNAASIDAQRLLAQAAALEREVLQVLRTHPFASSAANSVMDHEAALEELVDNASRGHVRAPAGTGTAPSGASASAGIGALPGTGSAGNGAGEQGPVPGDDRATAPGSSRPSDWVTVTISGRRVAAGTPQEAGGASGDSLAGATEGSSAPTDGAGAAASQDVLTAHFRQIDGLVRGSVAVSAPASADAGDSFTVLLRVRPGDLAPLIRSLETTHPENQTVKGDANVVLSSVMTASLAGAGFEVVAQGEPTQAVNAQGLTEWRWDVKAVESGLRTLNFSLSGAVLVDGKATPRNFYHYSKQVQVAVGLMGFVEAHWEWFAGAIILPAVSALWTAWHARKDKRGGGSPASVMDRVRQRRRLRAAG